MYDWFIIDVASLLDACLLLMGVISYYGCGLLVRVANLSDNGRDKLIVVVYS